MSKTKEALQMAREEIAGLNGDPKYSERFNDLLETIDEALAEQEPVAWIEQAMSQAQVMASAWSLVGSRFDNGNAMDDFKEAKRELHAMLAAAPEAPAWQELSEDDLHDVFEKAEKLMDSTFGLSWRRAVAHETATALRAKNGGAK